MGAAGKWLQFLLRIGELALAIVCVGILRHEDVTAASNSHANFVVHATLGGYIIITGVMIIGQLFGEAVGPKMETLYCLFGGILFVASGSVVIDTWRHYLDSSSTTGQKIGDFVINIGGGSTLADSAEKMVIMGSLAIINGVLYFVDTALSFMKLKA